MDAQSVSPSRLRRLIVTLLARSMGLIVILLGGVAVSLPLATQSRGAFILGLLMLATAACQIAYAYVHPRVDERRSGFAGAATPIITGLLLLAASNLVFKAMAVLLGISWIVDGLGKLAGVFRRSERTLKSALAFDGAISLIIGLAIAVQWPFSGAWTVYLAAGLRILATGWAMLLGRHRAASAEPEPAAPRDPQTAALTEQIAHDDEARAPIDRFWITTFLVTFFVIHVGRMQADWTLVGLFSPFIAVVGDVFFALLICYGLVVPARIALGLVTVPLARRLMRHAPIPDPTAPRRSVSSRLIGRWLRFRLRFVTRLERAARSPAEGLGLGLRIGLPPTAVLVAIAPLLGISWYFNTETWATGLWDHWAAHRTDAWRVEIIRAVSLDAQTRGVAKDAVFTVDPGPISAEEDFSFIVIGDTGEGDASQHILRDQLLALGARPDVKFLVLSSDVIYPQGAMQDYEPKFYLPFKGFAKPIYAIPGNHDWYDALEAFNANFLDPASAKAALHARRNSDHKLTTTTDATIDRMLAEAAFLRSDYGIRNGEQRGPFFDIQTPHFALIAVDTGILRSIDASQMQWVLQAFERAKGKFVMVLSGHPLYVAGQYAVPQGDAFGDFHRLCREQDVRLFMAGDTHDLEVYHEPYQLEARKGSMLHIVNGGGGAYLSIGTPLDWPATPALPDCGFYPRTDAIINKLNAEVPTLKRPLWWWTRKFKAWPSSPEMLASAFASNRAPFYQSFCEIRVEPSGGKVRVRPYGSNGRLRWRDIQLFGAQAAAGADADGLVEWTTDLPTR